MPRDFATNRDAAEAVHLASCHALLGSLCFSGEFGHIFIRDGANGPCTPVPEKSVREDSMANKKPGTSLLTTVTERTYKKQYAEGKALREKCPRQAHAEWKRPRARRDPVDTVLASEKGRIPKLLPLRHGRMVRSPFTFYRGSALAMAADLAITPSTGVRVQCCGDAHLCNFGGYA